MIDVILYYIPVLVCWFLLFRWLRVRLQESWFSRAGFFFTLIGGIFFSLVPLLNIAAIVMAIALFGEELLESDLTDKVMNWFGAPASKKFR